MTPLAWSFLLSIIGIVGLLLAGSKRKVGWVIGFAVQPLWIVFAVTTEQYGFILNAVIYAAVYARNWLRWRRDERPELGRRPPTVEPKGPAGDSGAQTGRWCNDTHGTSSASPRRYAPVHFHPEVRRDQGDIYDEIASGPADDDDIPSMIRPT